jgi:hypothetical protein
MWPFNRRRTHSKASPGDMRVVPVDNPAGAQSPYGGDHEFPLPPEKIRYDHPDRGRR